MTVFISVFNNKGGVGKTTLIFNIADAIGEKGKKVLAIVIFLLMPLEKIHLYHPLAGRLDVSLLRSFSNHGFRELDKGKYSRTRGLIRVRTLILF
jgi:hypothetical protein